MSGLREDAVCFSVTFADYPELLVTVDEEPSSTDPMMGVVSKITVDSRSEVSGGRVWQTADHPKWGSPGIKLGSSLNDVMARYGTVTLSPDEPNPGWRVTPDDQPAGGVRSWFRVNREYVVDQINLGLERSTTRPEGCIG